MVLTKFQANWSKGFSLLFALFTLPWSQFTTLAIKVDPLLQNLRTFPLLFRVPQPKFKANRSRGSCVMIGHTNKQTEITPLFLQIPKIIGLFFFKLCLVTNILWSGIINTGFLKYVFKGNKLIKLNLTLLNNGMFNLSKNSGRI